MMKLDFWIFGNGRGIAAPSMDQAFYWLVDRKAGGHFYTWLGGMGAQLFSYEWRCPLPGTSRTLLGDEVFTVFSARRRWLRWEVAWAGRPRTLDEIRQLRTRLV